MLDVSNKVTIAGRTVVMTPTGVASSIAALDDTDLTWLMVPSDLQRAPLMIKQINDLEPTLRAARGRSTLWLGVIYRNDALGLGTRDSLDVLKFNGLPLTDGVNFQNNVQFKGYDFKLAD